MPTIVVLLGVATAGAAFKMYVLDRRTKVKPTQSSANSAKNFAILDAELYGYENAVVQNRESLLNLYGDGLLLDSSLAVNTYSNRLRPEVRDAMRRTNFDLNAHLALSRDSRTNPANDLLFDPASILRSRTNRANIKVDTSGEIVQVAIGDERATSTTRTQLAKYDSKQVERPRAPELEPKKTSSAPRPSTTPGTGRSGIERATAPPDSQALFAKAKRLYASGDLKSAEELCVQLKKEAAGLKGLNNMLGEIYSRQRKWNDAVKQFEDALKEDSTNAEYHNNLGLVYSQLNKDNLAEEHFAKAQKIDPMNATIMLNYAWHYRKLKNYSNALKYFDLALVVDPNNVQARNKRIQTLLDLKRYSDVEEAIKSQLAANPRDAQATTMMAVLRTRQGDAKGAVEWLRKAEAITSRPSLLAMLEKINDFESIKDTPEYKDYLASLKASP